MNRILEWPLKWWENTTKIDHFATVHPKSIRLNQKRHTFTGILRYTLQSSVSATPKTLFEPCSCSCSCSSCCSSCHCDCWLNSRTLTTFITVILTESWHLFWRWTQFQIRHNPQHDVPVSTLCHVVYVSQMRQGLVDTRLTSVAVCQWDFQDPKMEVLYHIKPYFVGIFPYIGLKNRPYIW